MGYGLRTRPGGGPASPPYSVGPYDWDQRVNFSAGLSGANVQQYKATDVWYVDKTNCTVSGDGKSWENAFLTITEAVAAAGNYDTIFVGPGFYTEAAAITLSQVGLKIIGCNSSGKTRGPCAMKTPTAAGHMLIIPVNVNDVEICNIAFIATGAYNAITLGAAATGYIWRTHIHDCGFFGDDLGLYAIGVYGATTTPAAGAFPDVAESVVERCYFYAWVTACTCVYGTRVLLQDNIMFVPAAGCGIAHGCGRPFALITRNLIIGKESTDTGIKLTGDDDGSVLVYANVATNLNVPITPTISDAGNVANLEYKDGAVVGQIDPT